MFRSDYDYIYPLFISEFGCDYKQRDAFDRDLLFYSVVFGLDRVASELIISGDFDLFRRDKEGRTILFHAVCNNRIFIVRLLCSMMAKNSQLRSLLEEKDNYGTAPMDQAFSLGHETCLQLLLKARKGK